MKPYIITRLDGNGDYVAYDINKDRWGFGNDTAGVWPSSWWQRFDYTGTDPITNSPYSPIPVFTTANRSDHPDWVAFVRTFTVSQCYIVPSLIPIYQIKALARWKSAKGAWGGSCFGIAISNALAFQKKGEFLGKYPSFPNFTDPISVTGDTNTYPVINELFTHQFGNPHRAVRPSRLANTPTQTINEMKTMLREDNVKIRTLSFLSNDPSDPGGHAILAYKLVQDSIYKELYDVYVYDNSYPDSTSASIVVDTSDNGGSGSWQPMYGWSNWGGSKWFYLRDPAEDYLTNAILPKGSGTDSPFTLPDSVLQFFRGKAESVLITNGNNNSIGYYNGSLITNLPDAYPLIVENGSTGPPLGYELPGNSPYSILLNEFSGDEISAFLFEGKESFIYERDLAIQGQTDRLFFDEGLSVGNNDPQTKTVRLTYLISEIADEKLTSITSLDLAQYDSVKIESPDTNTVKMISFGSAKDYAIELNYVTENGLKIFEAINILLPENSAHIYMPDWSNISGSDLMVLLDQGNNGTIDDTLYLQNEVTSINDDQGSLLIPGEYRLDQNYPNPFNNSTVIRYAIPKEGLVKLEIFNALGEKITSLVREVKQAGSYTFSFNSVNLPSGVYFYRLESGKFTETKKMILLK
jgi:hypothetical protein